MKARIVNTAADIDNTTAREGAYEPRARYPSAVAAARSQIARVVEADYALQVLVNDRMILKMGFMMSPCHNEKVKDNFKLGACLQVRWCERRLLSG